MKGVVLSFWLGLSLLFVVVNCQFNVVFDNYLYNQPSGIGLLRAPEVTTSAAAVATDETRQIKWAPGFTVPAGEQWLVSLLEVGAVNPNLVSYFFSFYNDSQGLPAAFNSSSFVGQTPSGNSRQLGYVSVYNGTVTPALTFTQGNYWIQFYTAPTSSSNLFAAASINISLNSNPIRQAAWCGSGANCPLYFNGSDKVLGGRIGSNFPSNTWVPYTINPSIFALSGFKIGVCCLGPPNYNCTQVTPPECTALNGTFRGNINSTFFCTADLCRPSPSPSPSQTPTVTPTITPSPTPSLSVGASPSGTPTSSSSFGASTSPSSSLTSVASQSPVTGSGSTLYSWVSKLWC
eukprot:TRINITY_DN25473_c0_g1_i1.p1 TRINITY_DN25473_c0_g1~~TRINITY_DN25473_c0_g1_i1.p1  ORF type:complete len:347 (-),score=68.60 TRINITY_DN25473_c0_g1_i1:47-1087(-)